MKFSGFADLGGWLWVVTPNIGNTIKANFAIDNTMIC